ncbi:hypothetical protein Trydic_g18084 [Trypoxylus dichotomus]
MSILLIETVRYEKPSRERRVAPPCVLYSISSDLATILNPYTRQPPLITWLFGKEYQRPLPGPYAAAKKIPNFPLLDIEESHERLGGIYIASSRIRTMSTDCGGGVYAWFVCVVDGRRHLT